MVEHIGANIERYMDVLSTRQKLVASNIANADTPGYKTMDIDFQSVLAGQMSDVGVAPMEVPGLRAKNDGNNVNMDREARLLAENALRFSAASSLARSQLRMVKSAIDEGKSS